MKNIIRSIGRCLPEGKFKEFIRSNYYKRFNILYMLNKIISRTYTVNDYQVVELNDGTKFYTQCDKTLLPLMKYADLQKLGRVAELKLSSGFLIPLYEQYVKSIYEKHYNLKEGDIVVDVGAHVGTFTIKAAKSVGHTGRVIAIEPEAGNLILLQKNIEINSLANIVIVPEGVWSAPGKLKLNISQQTTGQHSFYKNVEHHDGDSKYQEVEINTLDNILNKLKIGKVDFIKMDIEGAEIEALKGMEEVLRNNDVKLAIAAYHIVDGKSTYKTITPQLKDRGFKVHAEDEFIYARRSFTQEKTNGKISNSLFSDSIKKEATTSILTRCVEFYNRYKGRGIKLPIQVLHYLILISVSSYLNFLNRKERAIREKFVIKEVLGSKMYLSTTDDGLPYELLVDGCREPCHTKDICRELKAGDIVVDIGANIGYFALMEARTVGDIGRVYAIEPVSENVQMLKRNIELNGYSNIEVYQLAIGDKNGSSVINISKKCNLSSMKKTKGDADSRLFINKQAVQEMTLDDFLEDKPYPSLIRMDTEGYEYNIIKGMTKILDKKLPLVLAIEFHFGILSPDESIALLRSLKIAGFQVLAAACEVRKVGFSKHRFLYNWALYLQRHCNIHPFGNLNLTIDDIISNQDILDGKWGPLNVCFKRS